jgi:hypothetical protein
MDLQRILDLTSCGHTLKLQLISFGNMTYCVLMSYKGPLERAVHCYFQVPSLKNI